MFTSSLAIVTDGSRHPRTRQELSTTARVIFDSAHTVNETGTKGADETVELKRSVLGTQRVGHTLEVAVGIESVSRNKN